MYAAFHLASPCKPAVLPRLAGHARFEAWNLMAFSLFRCSLLRPSSPLSVWVSIQQDSTWDPNRALKATRTMVLARCLLRVRILEMLDPPYVPYLISLALCSGDVGWAGSGKHASGSGGRGENCSKQRIHAMLEVTTSVKMFQLGSPDILVGRMADFPECSQFFLQWMRGTRR